MKQTIILISILAIFLIGCTETCPELNCPTCKCPTTNCPEQIQPVGEELIVYFIDVGQGDATLIKYGDTEMLILLNSRCLVSQWEVLLQTF